MSCGKWLFQCPNDIFVETGSGLGGGINYALKFGFKEIHSMEISKVNYDACSRMFQNDSRVHLYLGDSLDILPQILLKIKTKATFLLDAHVMSVDQTHGKEICPVMEELTAILKHSILVGEKHSIMIDDVKLFNGAVESFGNIKVSDIQKVVSDVSPNYVLRTHRKHISII